MKSIKKYLLFSVIGLCVCILLFIIISSIANQINTPSYIVSNTKNYVEKKEKELSHWIDKSIDTVSKMSKIDNFFSIDTLRILNNNNITLYFYVNDTLKWWTNNDVYIPNVINREKFDNKLIILDSGFYLAKHKSYSNVTVLGLALVKNEGGFNKHRTLNDGVIPAFVKIEFQKGGHSIYSTMGDFLFALKIPDKVPADENVALILMLVFSLMVLLSSIILYSLLILILKKPSLALNIIFFGLIVIIRVLFHLLEIPAILYKSTPFLLYSNSNIFMPTLGDVFIDVIFLLAFYVSTQKLTPYSAYRPFKKSDIFIAIFCSVVGCLTAYYYFSMIESLMLKTNLLSCFNNFLIFDKYSVLALVLIMLLAVLQYVYFHRIVALICQFTRKPKRCFFSASVGIVLTAIIAFPFFGITSLGISFFLIVMFAVYFLTGLKDWSKRSYSYVLTLLLVYSIFTGFYVFKTQIYKEREERKILAEQLFVESDPVTDYFFLKLSSLIQKDTIFERYFIEQKDKDSIKSYLHRKYIAGLWELYDVTVYSDYKDSKLFDSIHAFVHKKAIQSSTQGLFFTDDSLGNITYYSDRLKFFDKETESFWHFCFEFKRNQLLLPKNISNYILKKSIIDKNGFEQYSYAKFASGSLIFKKGEFQYANKLPPDLPVKGGIFFKKEGYMHLTVTHPNIHAILFISKKLAGVQDAVKIFSILFVVFTVLVFILYVISAISSKMKKSRTDFKSRLQFSIIILVVGSSIIFGIVSIYYINSITIQKSKDTYLQKINNIVIDLEADFKDVNNIEEVIKLGGGIEIENSYLLKHVTAYDPNLSMYDVSGKMILSEYADVSKSESALFLMNPFAKIFLYEMNESNFSGKQNTYSIRESILGANCENTYACVRNQKGTILAYISVPYLEQENSQKELMNFLMTDVTIYAFILLLLFVLLIFITDIIAKPLLSIKKQIETHTIGQKIEWRANDEIGALVREYNRMIDKMAENAQIVARIERERGLREMTRQVAHEIRTPLTPMKLSIQQLQKTWADKVPNFGERLERTIKVLVEQIDILSRLSRSFLDSTRMCQTIREKVNLIDCINSVINLYKDYDGLSIKFDTNQLTDCIIIADKQQIIRVFNNLFKNAEQAIPTEKEGMITVSIKENKNNYIIHVTDNGIGIPQDKKYLIFHPHLTSKENGTGLGLSIVKNVVDTFGGQITFESEEGVGTTFILTFPMMKDETVG